jgi:hypothetical protein
VTTAPVVELVPEARLTLQRTGLGEALERDPATGEIDVSVAPQAGKWQSLPAMVLRPANPWIIPGDGPKAARVSVDVELFVSQANVDTVTADLETLVETVLARLPNTWRFDYGGVPSYLNIADSAVLQCALTVSRPYSLTA